MQNFSLLFLIWAIALGVLSSISLPMGSLIGINARLKGNTISILAAFGAGALLAALSIELVAPTVEALSHEGGSASKGDPYMNFYALIIGAVLGGILFVVLEQMVNAHGGFLRKTATTLTHFRTAKRKRMHRILECLSRFSLLHHLRPEHVDALVKMVRPVVFNHDEVLLKQGEEGKVAYFIQEGTVTGQIDGRTVKEFNAGEIVGGIIPFITGSPLPGTAFAKGTVHCLAISKENFQRLRALSPEFDQACRDLARERLKILEKVYAARHEEASGWAKSAGEALRLSTEMPMAVELVKAKEDHKGASLAIWLGILLDGIPESFVIGCTLLVILQGEWEALGDLKFVDVIPYTLIAGLFLSNFPEALSSSANMKDQGWSKQRIFCMWLSLVIMAGIGAGLGYLLGGFLPSTLFAFTQGLAAGAMLTMIASAMIPDAVHRGNANTVGLSTLAGFFGALLFKLVG